MAMIVSDLTPIPTPQVETRYRRIRTPIPVPESIEAIQRLRTVEPKSMAGMPPIQWQQAQGFLVRDPYGNQWIDLCSGIVVANVGHAHPQIMNAIKKQVESQLIFTYAFPSDLRCRLLEKLVALAPPGLDKAIVFSAGTEATECAISLMRKHGLQISPQKVGILSFEQCYHGRTLSAKCAGGAPGLVDGIPRENVFHTLLPIPGSPTSKGFDEDLAASNVDPEKVAGFIFESIPGFTTTLYPQDYVKKLMEWTAAHQALVTVDEVQAGMGRTGRMFAFEHYGITPDLIACGKGLTSSLPVSAVIGRRQIMDLAEPGEMSSTFGGNPVCVAAALANLQVLEDEKLVERSASLGEKVEKTLNALCKRHRPYIRMHNGRGLFHSIHFKDPIGNEPLNDLCDQIALACIRRGVMLFVTGRALLKIVPPLNIETEALDEALSVIGEVMDETLT